MLAPLTPRLMSEQRRGLADYLHRYGQAYYSIMIQTGMQKIKPTGPVDDVSEWLAITEYGRIKNADLWFIGADTCELIREAQPTMPPFAPVQHDLPSRCGLIVFESQVFPELYTGSNSQLVGASWGPLLVHPGGQIPAGGAWFTFYTRIDWSELLPERPYMKEISECTELMIDNEAVVPWYPGDGDRTPFSLPSNTETTHGLARIVFAAFQLAGQQGICEQHTERLERSERRRTKRAGIAERDVTVVRLRHSDRGQPGDGGGREYQCRWAVRGHWRKQWYPSVQDHRPIWINQHVKGPDGAPLRGGERVIVV